MTPPDVLLLGDSAIGVELAGIEVPEILTELFPHFDNPLRNKPLRRDHQHTLHQSPQLQFADREARLDGLAETHLVGQQVAHLTRMGDHASQAPYLVGQRDYCRIQRGQQLAVVEQIQYPARHRREFCPRSGMLDTCRLLFLTDLFFAVK